MAVFNFEIKKSKVKLDIGMINILRTLCLTGIKFDTLVHPKESITPIDYDVKVKGQTILDIVIYYNRSIS
jgi:hypothetical protein